MSLKEHAVRLPPADTLRIFRTCQSGWPSLTCSFSSSSGDCRSGAGFFVPEAGGANSAREQGANKGAGRGNGFGAACWRGRTKKQGIAGSKAPTRAPAAREKPARVGVAGRRNKALPGARRQQRRRPRGTLIHVAFRKTEEIDDETLFAEVPSSISSRPPGGLE